MDHAAALSIFNAQTENVRFIKSSLKNFRKILNRALRKNDPNDVEINTKIFAMLFSAWAEVTFLKLIHTPYGFSLDEIEQIKSAHNLKEKWQKCIELALKRVESQRSGDVPNKIKKLNQLVNEFVIDPSLLRNKIAHGQLKVALNTKNTAVNNATTVELNNLDTIKIEKHIEIYRLISLIVEDLIESPDRAHPRDYWIHLTALESYIEKTKNWTLASKLVLLNKKPIITK